MRFTRPLPFLLIATATSLCAQTQPAPAPAAAPKLTDAQVSNVLSQLQELEKTILTQRASNLSTVLAKLNAAIASEQAAIKFYTDCDVLVNSERKEASKIEARQRQEMMERSMDRSKNKGGGGGAAAEEEGDIGTALQLGMRYLILTLEAHEAKEEDFKKMAPKLSSYIQEMTATAPKLKGRALGMLGRVCNGGSPVVEAFQLDRFLGAEHWSRNPTDIGGMFQQTLFFLAEKDAKDTLPSLWDTRLNYEAAFRKEQMPAPEYELWLQDDLPALRWQRAVYLYEKGPSPVTAMADMLKVIKEHPSHADAPSWVDTLRQFVNASAPVPTTSTQTESPSN
jgi:hypothetical protein